MKLRRQTGSTTFLSRPSISKSNSAPPDMGFYGASQRVVHLILESAKIFEDPLALQIIGAEGESKLRLSLAQFQKRAERDMRAFMMVRNRYTEDELARAVQRGVSQYVVLGAGLDTFAYRNPFPSLRVFEVDHLSTQVWKHSCLEKSAIPIPASVTYVSVDFEQQTITDALTRSGFRSDELAFFSCLGVTRYLTRNAFMSLLTSIVSSMRQGSEVVFDFFSPYPLQRLRQSASRIFFNWTSKNNHFRPSHYNPASLTRELQRIGFINVLLFGSNDLNALYCTDRTDGFRIRKESFLVQMRV